MTARLLICLACVLVLTTWSFAADTKVILNGNVVTLPVMDVDGKAFVDVVALMKLLGGKCTYDAANAKLFINSAGGGGGAGGGTTATGGSAASTGTAQLPGDNGQLGQVYTISKGDPKFFRLISAEYTVGHVVIGNILYSPKADEKLLVLHFTVQNPNKTTELFVRYDQLRFMAYDAANTGHEPEGAWGDEQSHANVDLNLKPAQTVSAYAVIRVPAKGPIVKLMVQPNTDNDGPLLRYMFTDQIKPLQAPFADPADATGYTALTTVPAQLGTPYPLTSFDMTIEKIKTVTTAVQDDAPPDGGAFLVATVLFKNMAPTESFLRYDQFLPVLTSTDGAELKYEGMVLATAKQSVEQNIKPGAQMRVRLYFTVPQGATPKTLDLRDSDSRTYEWEVK